MITDTGITLTYKEMDTYQQMIGDIFVPRKVAVIVCTNTIGCIITYLACMRQQVIPILLPYRRGDESFSVFLEKHRAEYLCIPDSTLSLEDWEKIYIFKEYCILKRKKKVTVCVHPDLALLLNTSGSLGESKCVRLSRENIYSNTKAIIEYLNIDSRDSAITALPMNYTYGLSVLHTHLEQGASLLLTDKGVMDKDFWAFFDRYQGTSFSGVPFTYEILKKFKLLERGHNSLQIMTQAGGKLNRETQRYFADLCDKKGARFFVMYGQTEATARISYLPYMQANEKLGSVGVAIPGGKISIENCEVVYRGKNVCMGYAESWKDLGKPDENNGVLHTKDSGYLKDGFLYITGRLSRDVKINGVRINLDVLEEKLSESAKEKCVCIFEEEKLFIFHENKRNEETVKLLMDLIPIQASHVKWIANRKIPLNASMKVDYCKLSEEIGNTEWENEEE